MPIRKIVLHCRSGYDSRLDKRVREYIAAGIRFIGVVGPDCERIEDIIDEICVGDGSREPYSMLTSSHPDASVEEALEFARQLSGEFTGEVELIEI